MSDCPHRERCCRHDSSGDESWWFAQSPEWKGYFARKLMESVPRKWSVWSSQLELGQAIADNGLLHLHHVNLSSRVDQWINASWIAPEDFHPIGSLADLAVALKQIEDVDCLYLSAHGGSEPGRFDTPIILDGIMGELEPLVDQALSPSGMIFFTGCNVAVRHPAALGAIAQSLHRPVVAATEWTRNLDTFPMGCRGVWIVFEPCRGQPDNTGEHAAPRAGPGPLMAAAPLVSTLPRGRHRKWQRNILRRAGQCPA